ncbi:MAG: hypothetical protein FD165_2670 [Gammaproteobacteria bacterium]|nr:MAG: hypothetical protein FD165_2670 [Gammaproteobacteria bacterium]TND01143.1 MAG: hypothetical protein FD120_2679 [Gammaproteobacteria bacterium]
MSAFNARLRPKEIFGIPLYAVGCALLFLPAAALATLIAIPAIKVVCGVLAVVALVAAAFFLVVGADLPFLRVMLQANSEDRCVTAETWTSD